jgi:hypothetical protein
MHTIEGHERDDTRNSDSYGWTNVVEIGKDSENFMNAENLMFFALGKLHMGLLDNTKLIIRSYGSQERKHDRAG